MFFLIHKPRGLSSFSAIAHLRKKFGIKKVGHTGTLDPLATGLLLVATGGSTKLISYLDKARKTYVFTARLDGWTASGDLDQPVQLLDSDVLEIARKTLTFEKIEEILRSDFLGNIKQTPPAHSAIWIDGQRAYDLARRGETVDIPERSVEIYSIRLLDFSFPEVTIEAEVSAGTYIRSIARDLGEKLGLSGYVTRLHRSRIGTLGEELSTRLDDIELTDAISYEVLFPDFPVIAPSAETIQDIRAGLIFDNTLNLEIGKKYLVKEGDIFASLIEEREGSVRVCANGIE